MLVPRYFLTVFYFNGSPGNQIQSSKATLIIILISCTFLTHNLTGLSQINSATKEEEWIKFVTSQQLNPDYRKDSINQPPYPQISTPLK